MKIDDGWQNLARLQPKSKLERNHSGNTEQSQGRVQDNVDLTTQASRMRSLEAALGDLPDTDVGKVEEVRQAIAEGRFQVDETVVANKLVVETMESLYHASKRA